MDVSAAGTTAQLEAMLDASDNPIIFTDDHGAITRWNRAAEAFYGYGADEVIGRSVDATCSIDPGHGSDEWLTRVCGAETLRELDDLHRDRDGASVPVSVTIAPLRDNAGDIVGSVRIVRNISKVEAAERAVRHLAAIVESSDD